MNRMLIALGATVSTLAIAPAANATVLLPGATGVPFQQFSTVVGTRGTLLESLQTLENSALGSYSEFLRSAVYRNSLGSLDFYFQVELVSIDAFEEIRGLTAAAFAGYTVDAFVDATDFDGAGIFTSVNNPGGSTTTASRSGSGQVVRADFGPNGLEAAGETSATYIFRTNAGSFSRDGGTFSTLNGETVTRSNFRPIGAPLPEPATWAMMLLGFGMVGFGLRRRSKVEQRVRFAV